MDAEIQAYIDKQLEGILARLSLLEEKTETHLESLRVTAAMAKEATLSISAGLMGHGG